MKSYLRPLLFAAGATAGLYYLFMKLVNRRGQKPATSESAVQTVHEDPVLRLRSAFDQVEPNVLRAEYFSYIIEIDRDQTLEITEENIVSPQYAGPVINYSCPRLFLEQLILCLSGKELLSSNRTLFFSFKRWHSQGSQKIYIRRHYLLFARGAVTLSWFILSNDFFVSSVKCPIWYAAAYRITITEHIGGHLTRVASYMFTKHLKETTSSGFQVTEAFLNYQILVINNDSWIAWAGSRSEVLPPDTKSESGSDSDSDSEFSPPFSAHSSTEETAPETDGHLEAEHVPALYTYAQIRKIYNFSSKLVALRQTFSFLLNDTRLYNYVCEAGRMILGEMATLNARDQTVFLQMYEDLLQVVQSPYNQGLIEEELAEIGIQHFNFIDIIFEVVVLGVMAGGRSRFCPRPGGFLALLMDTVSSFYDDSEQTTPMAKQLLHLVKTALLYLLENMFTLEDSVYEAPESLASAVQDLIEYYIEQLMNRLQTI